MFLCSREKKNFTLGAHFGSIYKLYFFYLGRDGQWHDRVHEDRERDELHEQHDFALVVDTLPGLGSRWYGPLSRRASES